MADLITVEQLEARLGTTFSGTGLTQVEGLIDDASALVRQVARWTDAQPTTVPGTIVAVMGQMLRRALDNPGELTAEQMGAYGWQAQQASGGERGGTLYVTRAERRIIREAAERPAVITIAADTGLGDPAFWSIEDDE
jgi:hypothetical protein